MVFAVLVFRSVEFYLGNLEVVTEMNSACGVVKWWDRILTAWVNICA